MTRNSKGVWVWGSFLPNENIFLTLLKKEVNSLLLSPEFDIHMTLCGPYEKISKEFLKDVELYCRNNYSFKVPLNGFKYQNNKFQSFYISVLRTSEIIKLRKNLFNIKRFPINNYYSPHISLAYGEHNIKRKEKLISELSQLPLALTLNKLSIVSVDENINKWEINNEFLFKQAF